MSGNRPAHPVRDPVLMIRAMPACRDVLHRRLRSGRPGVIEELLSTSRVVAYRLRLFCSLRFFQWPYA